MKKYKTENCNQYTAQNITICALTSDFNIKHKLGKPKPSLFIGGAFDPIPRKFAADILKQLRRTEALAKTLTKQKNDL